MTVDYGPPMQEGDRSKQIIFTGFGTPIGAIYKQARGTSGRKYRAEHRNGRWARFTSYSAAFTWLGDIERGMSGGLFDGELEPWPEPDAHDAEQDERAWEAGRWDA